MFSALLLLCTYFNPRSLAGATNKLWLPGVFIKFQSTLPRGSDIRGNIPLFLYFYFNPRSLAGATAGTRPLTPAAPDISIHAPSRERPLRSASLGAIFADFNPRSLAGATRDVYLAKNRLGQFQSTLPRGSDQNVLIFCKLCKHFNPLSLAGATPY